MMKYLILIGALFAVPTFAGVKHLKSEPLVFAGSDGQAVKVGQLVGELDLTKDTNGSTTFANVGNLSRWSPVNGADSFWGADSGTPYIGAVVEGGLYYLAHDILFYNIAAFGSNQAHIKIVCGGQTYFIFRNESSDSGHPAGQFAVKDFMFRARKSGPCQFGFENNVNGTNEIWLRASPKAQLYRIN